jgi:DNA repair protein RadC
MFVMSVRKDVLHKRKSNQKNGSPRECKSRSSSYASASERTDGERPSFSYQKSVRKNKKQWQVAEVQVSYKPVHDPSVKIFTAEDAYNVFRSMWDENLLNLQEQICAIFLNRDNQVIGFRCIHTGSSTASQFDLKLLFTLCCKLMAQGIILCHNHPSGNPKASNADVQMTRQVREAAKLFEV